MNDELIAALDDCLNAVTSGASVEDSLARHPALVEDLRPLLEAALAARALGEAVAVPRPVEMASRAKFLARAAELRAPARPAARRGFAGWLAPQPSTKTSKDAAGLAPRVLAIALAFLLGFVVGTYGVVAASAQSLPGDALYGVKRTVERAELFFSPDPQARARLEAQFAERRVREAQTVTAQGRSVAIEFRGLVESIEGERWSVAGIAVVVPPEARVDGVPVVGALAEVFGVSQADRTVRASRINVAEATPPAAPTPRPSRTPTPTVISTQPAPTGGESPQATAAPETEVEFTGLVESIGASVWRIGGQDVRLAPTTEIRGSPQVGQTVRVRAVREPGGALLARRIEVRESSSGPSASHTPRPEETPDDDDDDGTPGSGGGSGPSPSNTPQPTQTPGSGGGSGPSPSNTPESEEVRLEGVLQSISGSVWTVDGQAVIVTAETEIRDNPQIGDRVEVRALRQPDGTLIATRIEKD